MELDDLINNPLKRHKRRQRTSDKKIIKLIRTGEYDPSNMTHVRMKNYAIRKGLIDQDLNIIRRR